jgi:tRNA (Thr-GGU) A37 N-methylase
VRPNPLGFSVVRLDGVSGCRLAIHGADMLDGTPLLDIKPYVPEFDIFNAQRAGWYQSRRYE